MRKHSVFLPLNFSSILWAFLSVWFWNNNKKYEPSMTELVNVSIIHLGSLLGIDRKYIFFLCCIWIQICKALILELACPIVYPLFNCLRNKIYWTDTHFYLCCPRCTEFLSYIISFKNGQHLFFEWAQVWVSGLI
jgi:hypothetical protein